MPKVDDVAAKLRKQRMSESKPTVPDKLQGVSKQKVQQVLAELSLTNLDLVDAVYALLDNETDNWMRNAPKGAKFADGATTAGIACHIGILQRGKTKLDREGRDYWIKPLRDLGGFEAIYLHDDQFIAGHPKPKSPSSAYKLEDNFHMILAAPDGEWQHLLAEWIKEDVARKRVEFQASLAKTASALVSNDHGDLIKASVEHYAAKFLPDFRVLYVDDSDGDRVSIEEAEAMKMAGVSFNLGDAWPDILMWNPKTNWLWVIEAVTSDGEVDISKITKMTEFAKRHGKSGIGFTTTYLTWKRAAARQGTHRNAAIGSYIWIQADPAKQFLVESFG